MADDPDLSPRLAVHIGNFSPDGAEGWERLIEHARAADIAGIDKLVVSDHVVFGEQLDEYARPEVGGARGGRQPTGPDGHWLEPVTLLAYIAANTFRVRLATHVLLAALRRPAVLAKSLATLDVLSNGRVDVGVGVGWQRAEYDAAGLDFDDRGRLLDESLEICQTLWRERVATIAPAGRPIGPIHQMPKPVQPGGVPVWISGTLNRRVVGRLVRYGAGWIPWGDEAVDLEASVPRMRELVAAAGGDARRLRVVGNVANCASSSGGTDLDATLSVVPGLRAAGVTDFVARIRVPENGRPVDVFREWVDAFRSVATTGPSA